MISLRPPVSPRRSSLRAVLVCSALVAALLAPTAALASGTAVVIDCADDGKLDKKYSAADYASALKNIPTDVDEYTDCRDVIRRAQLGLAGNSGGGHSQGGGTAGGSGTTGGSTPSGGSPLKAYDDALAAASPAEKSAVQKATGSATPVTVAGRTLRADSLGHGDLGSLNSLPTPFVIILVLLGLGALAAAILRTRTFVLARRHPPTP